MRELREDTFSGNKYDDSHEHMERVLDIVSLFNMPRVTHDAVMLCVFPITLTRAAKIWFDRIPSRIISTRDLLEKAFIQRYCAPSKTAKQLKEIHNFKHEGDETLTWMTFGGNTRDLGSLREKTDKIADLHQIHKIVLFTKRGDGVAGIKRRRRDLSSDDVRNLATTSGRGRHKEDLELST
ncbi:hypothetical protein Tco_0773882 [Tanacetum coccineum]|uniref:Retrotransposon gag domain-containing protein n=1 Tax=Tanacetum coccineum TaxID=301880 RepID=A0ABQ4ZPJ7_9ASTR